MGFKQTDTHRNGKGSYHQIGLVRGQFGGVDFGQWLKFVQDAGFDGYEEATWEGQFDLRQADTDAGAAAFAQKRYETAKAHGLEIFTLATHLQGQVLGDEPSAKTLNFCRPGEARAAYKAWRAAGNNPPRTDPYYVPENVGKLIHEEARRDLLAGSSARRPTVGATGSCSRPCRRTSRGTTSPTCETCRWSCWPSASPPCAICASSTG